MAPKECEPLVSCMLDVMRHEPFYESGSLAYTEQGLFAGWMAHANSFAACQPFFNEARDIEILLSGECFPDPAMVAMLRRQGHRFENIMGAWLPHLYEERGERFWEELNGMFSGLLVDKREGRVVLFNDRYGTERLYWHETADAFYFASEAKALLRVLPELREFDLKQYRLSARMHQRCKGMKNYKLFRYEDLLAEPRKTLVELCEFIETDFMEDMLEPQKGRHEHQRSSLTGKQQKAFDPTAAVRWRKVISPLDNLLILGLTQTSMLRLDYDPETHPIARMADKYQQSVGA